MNEECRAGGRGGMGKEERKVAYGVRVCCSTERGRGTRLAKLWLRVWEAQGAFVPSLGVRAKKTVLKQTVDRWLGRGWLLDDSVQRPSCISLAVWCAGLARSLGLLPVAARFARSLSFPLDSGREVVLDESIFYVFFLIFFFSKIEINNLSMDSFFAIYF